MRRIFDLTVVALLVLLSEASQADVAFDQLSDAEAKKIIKEFSGNFSHTSVSGAAPLGDIFGFELGLVGGMTKTDEISKQAKQAGGDADNIPHGGIVGIVSFPLGLTGEALIIPSVGGDEFKFNSMGLAAKWTLTKLLLELPVDLAVRGHYTKSKLEFKQTVSTVDTNVDYENTTIGLQLLVSKSFVVVDPYAGIGYVSGDGDFSFAGAGAGAIMASGATKFSAKESSFQFLGGIEATLLFLKLGLEYSNQLGVNRFTGKIAFSF